MAVGRRPFETRGFSAIGRPLRASARGEGRGGAVRFP